MGLIKASLDAAKQVVGDQFKEFVTCPEVEKNVIIARGIVNHGSGNKNYTEGVITNGSKIAIPQGMAMMIIDNGKVVEFSADAGEYVWDNSSEPSVFTGGLGKGIIDSIKTIGQRITYGGQAAKDQRVYFVNIKIIPDNPFGSSQPEVIKDPVYESVEITYYGDYAIKVDDPIILINNIIGANPKDILTYDDIFTQEGENQLKGKFSQKVSEAIASIMLDNNVSFNEIQKYKSEVTDKMNDLLDEEWGSKYGIIVEDVNLHINASEESKKIIQEMDRDIASTRRMGKVYSDNMTGTMAAATGEAMKNAASNEGGSMVGFMGMNMASNVGTNIIGQAAEIDKNKENIDTPSGVGENTPKYCSNCGKPVNGNFCSFCGKKVE